MKIEKIQEDEFETLELYRKIKDVLLDSKEFQDIAVIYRLSKLLTEKILNL